MAAIRGLLFSLVILLLAKPVPAPVPRCSPFIFINKLAEFSNIWSDSNPYFPVPPCEYGGPLEAIKAGDKTAVFVTSQPQKIPLHNFYEFIWLLKTGLPRMARILAGKEPFIYDPNILKEKYQHYTPYVRTGQLGHGTPRRPEIIDDFGVYKRVVKSKIGSLIREGPDARPSAYTPLGPLRRQQSGLIGPSPSPRPYRRQATFSKPFSRASFAVRQEIEKGLRAVDSNAQQHSAVNSLASLAARRYGLETF